MPPNDVPPVSAFLHLYDEALPHVYGYLVRRCDSAATAEDLTADTFLAAATTVQRGGEVNLPWLIGTARHKLVDHWRRTGRHRQALEELWEHAEPPVDTNDPIDTIHVRDTLARLMPQHRAALVLRYVDGLAVPEVATLLDRSVHATESLIVRAKAAFRQAAADIHHEAPHHEAIHHEEGRDD
ncbi:MAG: RNA polymerase sigma factor [Actinobacteria bacterium]|nr:RNA polymerase sigma factor [Actinomycetota bacterium]